MALPINFPTSPYAVLDPDNRWFPDSVIREENFKLIPPLVYKIRCEVKEWRDNDYEGASETTKSLLHFWFEDDKYLNELSDYSEESIFIGDYIPTYSINQINIKKKRYEKYEIESKT